MEYQSLYARTKDYILKENLADSERRHEQVKRSHEAEIKVTLAHVRCLLDGDDRFKIVTMDDGRWFIAVGEDFYFTKEPGRPVKVSMPTTLCAKGCAAFLTNRQDFIDFMKNHLSHPDHEPPQVNQNF